MSEQAFAPGDVVQLRSGGPLVTVSYPSTENTEVIYFNSVSGLYAKFSTPNACLRSANQAPMVPGNAGALRNTTVAKSSL